jgi:surface protein
MKGDMNFDGVLDIVDYQQNVNFLLQNEYTPDTTELNEYNVLYDAADFNGDGAIDVLDAAALHIEINFGHPNEPEYNLGDALSRGIALVRQMGEVLVYDILPNESTDYDCSMGTFVSVETPLAEQDPLSTIELGLMIDKGNGQAIIEEIVLHRSLDNKYVYGENVAFSNEGYATVDVDDARYTEMILTEDGDKVYANIETNLGKIVEIHLFDTYYRSTSTNYTSSFECDVTDTLPYRTITSTVNYDGGISEEITFYATSLDGTHYTYWYGQDVASNLVVKNGGTYSAKRVNGKIELMIDTNVIRDDFGNFVSCQKENNYTTMFLSHNDNSDFYKGSRTPTINYFETIRSLNFSSYTINLPKMYYYFILAKLNNKTQALGCLNEVFIKQTNDTTVKCTPTEVMITDYPDEPPVTFFCESSLTNNQTYFKNLEKLSNFAVPDELQCGVVSSQPLDVESIKYFEDVENKRVVRQYYPDIMQPIVYYNFNYPSMECDIEDDDIFNNIVLMGKSYSECSNIYYYDYNDIVGHDFSVYDIEYVLPVEYITTPTGGYRGDKIRIDGYEFAGWSTTRNEEDIVFPASRFENSDGDREYMISISLDELLKFWTPSTRSTTLYAIWKPIGSTSPDITEPNTMMAFYNHYGEALTENTFLSNATYDIQSIEFTTYGKNALSKPEDDGFIMTDDINDLSPDNNMAIDLSEKQDKGIIAYLSMRNNKKTLLIAGRQGQKIVAPEDMSGMFMNLENLESIDFNSMFDTSEVKYMFATFAFCGKLKVLDLSSFNTKNLISLEYTFADSFSLEYINFDDFNTENVTTMAGMFYGCSGLEGLVISSFDTSKVMNMEYMFYNCSNLKYILVDDLWQISSKTNTDGMFEGCGTNSVM